MMMEYNNKLSALRNEGSVGATGGMLQQQQVVSQTIQQV
jgi:hypothetical protein